MSDLILKADSLSKAFTADAGIFAKSDNLLYAVKDVSFDIERGQTFGLVGESGCGKTTTARMLVGMYKPTSGSILYYGNDAGVGNGKYARLENGAYSVTANAGGMVANANSVPSNSGGKTFTGNVASNSPRDISTLSKRELKNYREKVKYIFQDPARSLNPRMEIFSILSSGLKYSGEKLKKDELVFKCANVLREVGFSEDDLWKKPSEFSGGQRQRISIARGLIMEPEMLICDEVVSALDVSIQAQILNLLCDIRKKRNLSMVFITHDLKVACYFCDVIGVMYKGEIVEKADAETIYKTPQHDYTKKLFSGAEGIVTK